MSRGSRRTLGVRVTWILVISLADGAVKRICVRQVDCLGGCRIKDVLGLAQCLDPCRRALNWLLVEDLVGSEEAVWPPSASFNSCGSEDCLAQLCRILSTPTDLFSLQGYAEQQLVRCHLARDCVCDLLGVGEPLVCLLDWITIGVGASICPNVTVDHVDVVPHGEFSYFR